MRTTNLATPIVTRTLSAKEALGEGLLRIEGDDVILRSPTGRIIIEASGVEVRADRTDIESATLNVTARTASLHSGETTIIADVIRTTADEVATHVGRWELQAKRVVERALVAVRDNDVVQATVDRMRLFARDSLQLLAKRTAIVSEEDTTVDGKRVLLG
jgi:hypothetical protein